MTTVRSLLVRAAVLLILAATAFAVFSYTSSVKERAAVGRAAPAFDLPRADGGSLSLASLRGRVAVVNFFASWCDVCRLEAPALEAFQRRYGDRVAVAGVDWREPMDTVRGFGGRFGLTYPLARDADGSVARAYALTGVPETWVVRPDGRISTHIIGGSSFERLVDEAERAGGKPLDPGGVGPVAPGARAQSFAIADGRLWVRTNGDPNLFSSADGGVTWTAGSQPSSRSSEPVPIENPRMQPQGSGIPERVGIHALDVAGPVAYLTTDQGVFRSEDGGATWQPTGYRQPRAEAAAMSSPSAAMMETEPLQAWGIARGPGDAIYLAAQQGVWVASGDAPAHPVPGTPVRQFVGVAFAGGTLWALAPNGDLYFRRMADASAAGTAAAPSPPGPGHVADAGGGWFRVLPAGSR